MQSRQNPDKESYEAYQQHKQAYRKLMGAENYRYMKFHLWPEGVALYTEWKILGLLNPDHYQPLPFLWHWKTTCPMIVCSKTFSGVLPTNSKT